MFGSIHTNVGAMAALATLRSIDEQMQTTMERLSTGLKVNSAKDNPAYWSIATSMRSDIKAKNAVVDSLGISHAVLDTAVTGMTSAGQLVDEIKSKLVLAAEPGADKNKINSEIQELKSQLQSVAQSSSFNGQNLLYNASGSLTMPTSIQNLNGTSVIGYNSVNTSGTNLIDPGTASGGLLTKDRTVTQKSGATGTYYLIKSASGNGAGASEIKIDQNTTQDELSGMLQAVEDMAKDVTAANSTLGAKLKGVENQENFTRKLIDTLQKGLGRLVDANMEEESTRLKALQTQKQLAIQALSIANAEPNYLLQLFK